MPTATFEYTHGNQRATSFVRGVASLSDAEALALALLPYTNAAIPRVGWTISSLPQHPEKMGDFADLDSLGITIFRDVDNRIVKLVLPAPVSSSYDLTARVRDEKNGRRRARGDSGGEDRPNPHISARFRRFKT